MNRRITTLMLAVIAALASPAAAQTDTEFTYQGRLDFQGEPYTGTADFTFTLWTGSQIGSQIGSEFTLDGVSVEAGLFSAEIDFGAEAFAGRRWLEISVRTPAWDGQGDEPPFTTLDPRQAVTRAPYSIQTRGIFVDENGSVGIGTTNPRFALTLRGTGANSDAIQFLNDGGFRKWHISQTDGGLDFVETGIEANRLYLAPFGGVGIGTRPIRDLSVRGEMGIENAAGAEKISVLSDVGNGSSAWFMRNSSGNVFIVATTIANNPDNGSLSVGDNQDAFKAAMFVNSNGQGVVSADIKNFRVPNPADPATDIVYASIEGPEAAMYARGSATLVDGRARVELPDHFASLAVLDGMTITLTPGLFESKGLAWANKSLAGFDVGELNGGTGNYEFDWEVKAVRRGFEDYRVVRPWDELLPAGTEREKAWKRRLALIAARRDAVSLTAAGEHGR